MVLVPRAPGGEPTNRPDRRGRAGPGPVQDAVRRGPGSRSTGVVARVRARAAGELVGAVGRGPGDVRGAADLEPRAYRGTSLDVVTAANTLMLCCCFLSLYANYGESG